MGLPQDYGMADIDETQVTIPFPAPTKQVAGEVNGVKTDVMHMSFADKIMITVTQNGRLSQWVCTLSQRGHPVYLSCLKLTWEKVTVPLLSDNPTQSDPYFQTLRSEDDSLLPSARFSPRILLGAGGSDREAMGQLYASQIANAIVTKSPEESRPLMLGLGLAKVDVDRDVFLQIIDLILSVL
jgi:proteasome assembly chaperone 3